MPERLPDRLRREVAYGGDGADGSKMTYAVPSLPKRSRGGMRTRIHLQFDPNEIDEYADRYAFEEDSEALEAGRRIREGDYSRENLEAIFEWKTGGRGRSRIANNSDDEIVDALHLAATAHSDRGAVAALLGLSGVQVPVASAILTAIDPERFTVIDFRALEALGVIKSNITVDFYLEYLDACRALPDEHNQTRHNAKFRGAVNFPSYALAQQATIFTD